jgi:hypothetical protein
MLNSRAAIVLRDLQTPIERRGGRRTKGSGIFRLEYLCFHGNRRLAGAMKSGNGAMQSQRNHSTAIISGTPIPTAFLGIETRRSGEPTVISSMFAVSHLQ